MIVRAWMWRTTLGLTVSGLSLLGGCQADSAPPVASDSLKAVTGNWTLSRLSGRDVAVLIQQGMRAPTLSISPDGGISGHAGVNRLTGSTDPRDLAEGKIDLSKLVTTRMAATPAAMELENAYLAALAKAKTYSINRGQLELKDGPVTVATFTRGGR